MEGIKGQVDVYVLVRHLVSPSMKSVRNPVHSLSCKMNVSPKYKIMVDGSFFCKK